MEVAFKTFYNNDGVEEAIAANVKHSDDVDVVEHKVEDDVEVKVKNVGKKLDNYLVTWLSFVGPNVGLYLDNAYAKLSEKLSW